MKEVYVYYVSDSIDGIQVLQTCTVVDMKQWGLYAFPASIGYYGWRFPEDRSTI